MFSFAGFVVVGGLEKLKRGFERVVASLAKVGRKERVSTEATLVPLAMLHIHTSASPCPPL